MSKSLKWNGDAITGNMRQAQVLGVNKTMGDCVKHAKANHPWKNQSGILEGSINIVDFAARQGNGVEGRWGSQDVRYALIHELGGVIVPVKAVALAIPQPGGGVRFVKRVVIPKRPYLRPAADATYPELPANIKAAYAKLSGSSAPPEGFAP
ncbi:MAG: phage morphogenesis protein [Pseudomonadota bacterium]